MRILAFILAGFILAGTSATTTLIGQEFRIETEVYSGEASEPISENLTLFSGNLIFDFMLPTDGARFPEEVVIYQSREKQFVLLDTSRQIKTLLIEGELLKILAALQSSDIADEKNAFLFHPAFTETWDESSRWLTLASDQLTYRTRGDRPENENALHKYYEFIDQFARLNATDPKRMPPFARLKLNSSLKKFGFIPSVVEVTLIPSLDPPADPIEVKTRHNVMWQLSEKDQERIESAKRYWMDFKSVSLAEFRQIQEVAETSSQTEDR